MKHRRTYKHRRNRRRITQHRPPPPAQDQSAAVVVVVRQKENLEFNKQGQLDYTVENASKIRQLFSEDSPLLERVTSMYISSQITSAQHANKQLIHHIARSTHLRNPIVLILDSIRPFEAALVSTKRFPKIYIKSGLPDNIRPVFQPSVEEITIVVYPAEYTKVSAMQHLYTAITSHASAKVMLNLNPSPSSSSSTAITIPSTAFLSEMKRISDMPTVDIHTGSRLLITAWREYVTIISIFTASDLAWFIALLQQQQVSLPQVHTVRLHAAVKREQKGNDEYEIDHLYTLYKLVQQWKWKLQVFPQQDPSLQLFRNFIVEFERIIVG
jgi:hypothetical protein